MYPNEDICYQYLRRAKTEKKALELMVAAGIEPAYAQEVCAIAYGRSKGDLVGGVLESDERFYRKVEAARAKALAAAQQPAPPPVVVGPKKEHLPPRYDPALAAARRQTPPAQP